MLYPVLNLSGKQEGRDCHVFLIEKEREFHVEGRFCCFLILLPYLNFKFSQVIYYIR
jgi:hypothetical protein